MSANCKSPTALGRYNGNCKDKHNIEKSKA